MYPRGKYENIVVFSAQRTGSSLVYNIFKFLFEDDSELLSDHSKFDLGRVVLKTHRFSELDSTNKTNTLCIFTFRNPIQASISNFRICMRSSINNKELAKEFIQKHYAYFLFHKKKELEKWNVLNMRYEDFSNNIDHIFDIIENHFNFTIDSRDKEIMRIAYSKESIQNCIRNLKSFKESLPISGFHGKHINSNNYVPPADFLYWLNIYLDDVKQLFQSYGYFLDS
jgi:hypothetical protein